MRAAWRIADALGCSIDLVVGRDPDEAQGSKVQRPYSSLTPESRRRFDESREKVVNGDIVARNGWTFDEYGEHYVDARLAAGEIEKRSAGSFKAQLHMIGHLIGSMKMRKITPQVIGAAYADLRAGKSRSGRKISGTSLNDVNKIAWLVFKDASDKGVMGANPLERMAIPRRDTSFDQRKRNQSRISLSNAN